MVIDTVCLMLLHGAISDARLHLATCTCLVVFHFILGDLFPTRGAGLGGMALLKVLILLPDGDRLLANLTECDVSPAVALM